MTARRGDLVYLTVEQAREFPVGTLLADSDGASTWWKRSQNTWKKLEPEVEVMRLSSAMAGGTYWVLWSELHVS